jgi:hypothetical protein
MTILSLAVQVYRPLQHVFTFVATPENDFQWQYGTLESNKLSDGDMGVGTLFRTTAHFMERRIESTYQVTEFEVNKRYGFASLSGPVNSRTLYTFEMAQHRTRISVSTEIHSSDGLSFDNHIAMRKFRKQYKENLALLKSILETPKIAER